jgi:hypothetical protein
VEAAEHPLSFKIELFTNLKNKNYEHKFDYWKFQRDCN